MRPQEIIAKKRDGGELSDAEIRSFIDGVCDGAWADYQTSALIMAMVIRGMSLAEQDAITDAMLHSGEVLDLSSIEKPKGDKHSTGGVGDKTSLIIAPIMAACGVAVPMISGRGLGHTGGTLDKLEAIPGYRVNLTKSEFYRVIDQCGFAMAGQTAEIAPADKKIYALRDATATVPCLPLIVASIMSKKLAEGLDALILDVKTGSGAFMTKFEDSKALAEALVRAGRNFGVKTEAVISDMSQPLGRFVGNAVETYECIQILRGVSDEAWAATTDLSVELSGRLLVLAGVSDTVESGRDLATAKLSTGEAFEKFRENVELQGGDPKVCDEPDSLLSANLVTAEVRSSKDGFVTEIDTSAIGNAICEIGGGRTKADDLVDHGVGFESLCRIGTRVKAGEKLAILSGRKQEQADAVARLLSKAYSIGDEATPSGSIVKAVVSHPA